MRRLSEQDRDRLNDFLLGLDEEAMLMSELDGFLAGVVVCPETILPSEWLPLIWGPEGPGFDDGSHANDILGLIMGRYNEIARGLQRRGRFQPILEQDNDETFIWELWAEGFAKAVRLRKNDCWDLFESADEEEVRAAIGFLSMLATHALTGERLDDPLDNEIRADADRFIANCLETLNAARMAAYPSAYAKAAPTVGRNDPCPCGSGKKFKKCCLQ